jgi:DNA polymerase-3 subunit delta'
MRFSSHWRNRSQATLFLLVSSESYRLLPTIRSRCQAMPVRSPAHDVAGQWLRDAGVSDAGSWLALAGGSPLLALELSSSGERVLLDSLLAQVARARDSTLGGRCRQPRQAGQGRKAPGALKRVVDWAQKWLFDLTSGERGSAATLFPGADAAAASLAQTTDTSQALGIQHRKAIQYKAQCEQPLNSRLFLEEFFLSYARLFRTS